MGADVQVMFLVTTAVVATGYAFLLDVRRGAELGRFLEWLKTERRPSWDALTRSDRFLTIRAVEILRRGPLADDGEFLARYRMTRHGRTFLVAMGVACSAIALVITGTTIFDWSW